MPCIMKLMVSSIFKLGIRENKFKASENQNHLVDKSNWQFWKNSLTVVPIDIQENFKK